MPVKNYFPVFHKLRSGAYSYVWTDKCERLLPQHYKQRCLEYMLREPKPVHWKPDTRKYEFDKHGTLMPVQNHPVRVRYPLQCNYGLWAGEGVVQCWSRNVKSIKHADVMTHRVAKYYVPFLSMRALKSEILDKWFKVPCTSRALDLIDENFGLDYYILKTHERDLNSKLAMDLRRKMLLQLCDDVENPKLPKNRRKILNRYREFMIPRQEAEWVGLSIKEALEKAEKEIADKPTHPLHDLITKQFLKELEDFLAKQEANESTSSWTESEPGTPEVKKETSSGLFSFLQRKKPTEEKR